MSDTQARVEEKYIEEGWFQKTPVGVELIGIKCLACNKVFFPKKEVCPICYYGELIEVSLSKRGRLHTFAHSAMGPPHLGKPYLFGFIDLPEGIKLFSLLTECEPWEKVLKLGMEMEMTVGKLYQDKLGTDIIGYKFRPIKEAKE